jgi:hypothetical protein
LTPAISSRWWRSSVGAAVAIATAAATILAPPSSRTARAQGGAPALYVFLQLDVKSSILEKTLQARLPGVAVTVFGRFRDFQDAIATKPPAAVLAVSPLLEQEHQKVTLQGVRGGKDWEPYVLASVGPMKSVGGKTVGIVDLFGHDGTQAFAANLLKTNDVKIKRVAKIEDLLPLIEFSAADAILIPAAGVKRLTERTRLPLAVRELPNGRFGLPAIGVVDPAARDAIVRLIQELDAPTRGLLGVDGWELK